LLAREAARLRAERYELAIVLRPDHWWGALLAAAAGIPIRVGAATPETIPLLTHTRAVPPKQHATEQALGLARLALAALRLPPNESRPSHQFRVRASARAEADALWHSHALHGRRVVALQPSAGAHLKRWPIDRWAALVEALSATGCAVVLTGGPADGRLLADIAAATPARPAATLCGQSLEVTAAIFERCALLIGLDGGAAHLAATVGTPTVRLFGPASADVYGPWPSGPEQRVLATSGLGCVPCGHLEAPPCGALTMPACLLALGVDQVLDAARTILSRS
jgi:ADP-heptose:LPS heptosyltransferase